MADSVGGVGSADRTFDNGFVQATDQTSGIVTNDVSSNPATAYNLQGYEARTVFDQAGLTRTNLEAQLREIPPMSPGSEARLARVNPELAGRIRAMAADLKAQGINIIVTNGLRTFEEQTALYAQGRESLSRVNELRQQAGMPPISASANASRVTNARADSSFHNYGLAVDIVPLDANGQPNYNVGNSVWDAIGVAGERYGLTWGGRFSSIVDKPHFQLDGGRSSTSTYLDIYNRNGLQAVWDDVNSRPPPIGNLPPNPPSPPASNNLQQGSRGPAVTKLQRDLNGLGYRLTADGVFGSQTDAAVRAFQRDHNLTVDGIVGPRTRAAIETAKNANQTPVPTATLRRGSRGEQVKQLQTALVRLGFMTQADMNTGPGIFGPKTDAALRSFQRAKGLSADGIYGPRTRAALSTALNGTNGTPPTPPVPTLPVPTATLKQGSRGEQVRQLQNALVRLGFMTQAQMNTGPGIFGLRTDAALRAFQRSNGLSADGIYGPRTRAALTNALGGTPPVNPPNPGTVTPDNLVRVPGSENVSRAFKQKVIDIAGRLNMNPNHLMAIMSFESGINPRAVNPLSNATGLIQFLPSTARGLGTTVEALRGMSAERQLDFVEQYLSPYRGRMNTVEDAYMAVFYPVAIGRANSSTLFSRGSTAYSQNSSLDLNRDGTITKGEAATRVRQILENAAR